MKICYTVHIQNIGWMPWEYDGNQTGTTGQDLRMEAMNIKLTTDNS